MVNSGMGGLKIGLTSGEGEGVGRGVGVAVGVGVVYLKDDGGGVGDGVGDEVGAGVGLGVGEVSVRVCAFTVLAVIRLEHPIIRARINTKLLARLLMF